MDYWPNNNNLEIYITVSPPPLIFSEKKSSHLIFSEK